MAKVKSYQGTVPTGENWQLKKIVVFEGQEWGFYISKKDLGYTIKIVCHGKAKRKANYWTGFFSNTKSVWYTRDLLLLKNRQKLYNQLLVMVGLSENDISSNYIRKNHEP